MRSAAVLAFAGAAAAFAPPADAGPAPVAASTFTVDWSGFVVTLSGENGGAAPVLTWSQRSTSIDAQTPVTDSVVADWTTPISASHGGPPTFSTAAADAAQLRTDAHDGDPRADTSAAPLAERTAQFDVAGSGHVTITVPYAWQTSLVASLAPVGSAPLSFAYALGSLTAETRYFLPFVNDRSYNDTIDVQKISSFPDDHGNASGNGTLTLDFDVLDGDHFCFTAMTESTTNLVSTVPAPPSAALLGAGLGVIGVALRRRRAGLSPEL
jgi:hypothetical protein